MRSSAMSALPLILLQKSFLGDERNFLGPLMRFVCGDVRDLIVSHKTDHGPAHWRYRALQQWRCLKICFREIFGIVRFSTFATISPYQRTSSGCLGMSEKCHFRTYAPQQTASRRRRRETSVRSARPTQDSFCSPTRPDFLRPAVVEPIACRNSSASSPPSDRR